MSERVESELLSPMFDVPIGEFKPCTVYYEGLDWFEYREQECCTVSEHQSGTNIVLLRKWDGEKYCGIVGVRIEGFSDVAMRGVTEALRAGRIALGLDPAEAAAE